MEPKFKLGDVVMHKCGRIWSHEVNKIATKGKQITLPFIVVEVVLSTSFAGSSYSYVVMGDTCEYLSMPEIAIEPYENIP